MWGGKDQDSPRNLAACAGGDGATQRGGRRPRDDWEKPGDPSGCVECAMPGRHPMAVLGRELGVKDRCPGTRTVQYRGRTFESHGNRNSHLNREEGEERRTWAQTRRTSTIRVWGTQ